MLNKILFSQRLKDKRKEKGYASQEAFAEKYNSEYPKRDRSDMQEGSIKKKTSGILGTLKNYENDFNNVSPSLDVVSNMCNILECDIGYLVGETELSTHDIQFIHDQTGLSEKSIKFLQGFDNKKGGNLDTINYLIEQWVDMTEELKKRENGLSHNYQIPVLQCISNYLFCGSVKSLFVDHGDYEEPESAGLNDNEMVWITTEYNDKQYHNDDRMISRRSAALDMNDFYSEYHLMKITSELEDLKKRINNK